MIRLTMAIIVPARVWDGGRHRIDGTRGGRTGAAAATGCAGIDACGRLQRHRDGQPDSILIQPPPGIPFLLNA
jgi:hypothetical protein